MRRPIYFVINNYLKLQKCRLSLQTRIEEPKKNAKKLGLPKPGLPGCLQQNTSVECVVIKSKLDLSTSAIRILVKRGFIQIIIILTSICICINTFRSGGNTLLHKNLHDQNTVINSPIDLQALQCIDYIHMHLAL